MGGREAEQQDVCLHLIKSITGLRVQSSGDCGVILMYPLYEPAARELNETLECSRENEDHISIKET